MRRSADFADGAQIQRRFLVAAARAGAAEGFVGGGGGVIEDRAGVGVFRGGGSVRGYGEDAADLHRFVEWVCRDDGDDEAGRFAAEGGIDRHGNRDYRDAGSDQFRLGGIVEQFAQLDRGAGDRQRRGYQQCAITPRDAGDEQDGRGDAEDRGELKVDAWNRREFANDNGRQIPNHRHRQNQSGEQALVRWTLPDAPECECRGDGDEHGGGEAEDRVAVPLGGDVDDHQYRRDRTEEFVPHPPAGERGSSGKDEDRFDFAPARQTEDEGERAAQPERRLEAGAEEAVFVDHPFRGADGENGGEDAFRKRKQREKSERRRHRNRGEDGEDDAQQEAVVFPRRRRLRRHDLPHRLRPFLGDRWSGWPLHPALRSRACVRKSPTIAAIVETSR